MDRPVTLLARVLLALAFLLALPAAALAHAELDTARPGPDDVISEVPDELVATFTQDIDPSRSSIELLDENGDVAATGEASADDPREMRMPLPDLEPAVYEVRWTTFSAEDLELVRDRYTFTVEAAATPTSTVARTATAAASASATPSASPSAPASPSASPTPATPGTGDPAALVPIVAAAAVAGGLGVWLVRSRAR